MSNELPTLCALLAEVEKLGAFVRIDAHNEYRTSFGVTQQERLIAKVRSLYSAAQQGREDSARLDWLEQTTRAGRTIPLSWFDRQRSTVDEWAHYDIPAGFYTDEESDPQPTLRAAIDAAILAERSDATPAFEEFPAVGLSPEES